VTSVDHFGIEPDPTFSRRRAVSLLPEHVPATLGVEGARAPQVWRASLNPPLRGAREFSSLIGKYQWRLVAVGAWCRREKKSGELCFE
jgi:hypothetical protein